MIRLYPHQDNCNSGPQGRSRSPKNEVLRIGAGRQSRAKTSCCGLFLIGTKRIEVRFFEIGNFRWTAS